MASDWSRAYGGGTSSGTSDWAKAYGGGSGSVRYAPTHPSGGGGGDTFLGGLFGGIAHEVESVTHPITTPINWVDRKFTQPAAHLGEGFALGLAELGKVVGEDFYNTWRHPSLKGPTKENSHFYNEIVVPQAKDVSHKFAPILQHPARGSSYDPVRRDPFGTALDLLALGTIPLGGEAAAIKGATLADRLGMADTVAGRALARAAVRANEARAPYDVAYAPNEAAGGVFKADRARTAQGRYIYNPIREAVGKAFKGSIPYVGNAARFNRSVDQAVNIGLGPDYAMLRALDTAIGAHIRPSKRLTPGERVALDVIPGYGPEAARAAALGVPRQQLLDYYTKKLVIVRQHLAGDLSRAARTEAKVVERAISGKVRLLTRNADEIDHAIKTPRPIMAQVTEQAKHIADSMGQWMIDAHLATPETIADRPFLEQRLIAGDTYSAGKPLGYEQARPNYAEARSEYDAAKAAHDELMAHLEQVAPGAETAPLGAPAPGLPTPVATEGEPTFLMKIPSNFYREAEAKGLDIGSVTAERKALTGRPGVVTVRLTEGQFRELERAAKADGRSSTRAARNAINEQRPAMLAELTKKARKLDWKQDKASGAWHLEGTDYAIHTNPQTGERIAVRGDEHLGTFRELPEAKTVIENEVARTRSEALQEERRAQTAAGPADPFMAAIGEYREASTARDQLTVRGPGVSQAEIDAAEQRFQRAADTLRTARTRAGAKREIRTEPGFTGGNINFDQIQLEHPDAFYKPHSGPEIKRGRGAFQPTAHGVGAPKVPGESKLNKGYRFETGQLESGPQVWTPAGLHLLRFKAITETLSRYRPVMVPYDGVGGSAPLREGYGPVNIRFDEQGHIKPRQLTRGQKESAALDENVLSLTPAAEHKQLTDTLNGLFPHEHQELQVATYQMPLRDIKKIKGDYKRSGWVIRNLIDKPLAVWKALVLKNRPAWLINNLFGQHALLLLHNGVQFQNYMEAMKPNQRKEINDAIHGITMGGTSSLAAGAARFGTHEGPMSAGLYGRGPQAIALTGHGASHVINAWGNLIAHWNQKYADDIPRTTLAVKYLKEKKQAMRHLEIANGAVHSAVEGKSLAEVARMLSQDDKAEILRKVNRYLGDFNSMSGSSARQLRRILPFVTWFKVIMQISADLTLDHPEKLLFFHALEQAGEKDRGLAPAVNTLPSWYQGSLVAPFLPGPSEPGTGGILSTTAINPFNTPVQLGQQVGSFFRTGVPGGTDNPVASLGPLAEMVNLAQGVDPFFGGAYQGPGEKQSPVVRALAGTIFGLPETRLLQQGGVAPYYQAPKSYKDTYVDVGGHQVPLDALLRYIGYPVRRIDKRAVAQYAKEGR